MTDQRVEITNQEPSIHPLVALKIDWLNDARQMMKLRRLHLAQEWHIPLSLLATDENKPAPPPVQVTQTSQAGSFLKHALVGAGIATGALGLGALAGHFLTSGAAATAIERVWDSSVDIQVEPPTKQ